MSVILYFWWHMASFNISKVEIDKDGKIHVYEGKVSHVFGDRGRLEEMANRLNIKDGDIGIQQAAKRILQLTPDLSEIEGIKGVPIDLATVKAAWQR